MAGSSSQASTLVQRGGATGENRVATRSTPSGTVGRRRPSTRSSAPSKQNYFYTEDSSLIKFTPTQVIVGSIAFIVFVFSMHIIGKLRA